MVLEQIYPLKLIEKNPLYALLLGVSYSIIGVGASLLLFPEDPAIVAVAFIALIAAPTLSKLLKQEEGIESKKRSFSLINFYKDHKNVFIIYLLLFFGIFLAFSFFALVLPSLTTNHIFENQLNVLYGTKTGQAIFSKTLFLDILRNNLSVMALCFITSFVFGDGGIFLITWNASVWGTIFGNLAKTASSHAIQSPSYYFFIVLAIVFPHMILEVFSYISSATAGGIMSKGFLGESFFSKRFKAVTKNTVILFAFALLILIIAVVVETFVLNNSSIYSKIVRLSFS
ncbi:MAG: stage II sporulation protein M [Nanoarchaeota archaeon]